MTVRVSVLGLAIIIFQPTANPAAGLLITHSQLIDGTGAPARPADVRVAGDAISDIGTGLAPRPGERVIDAGGKSWRQVSSICTATPIAGSTTLRTRPRR